MARHITFSARLLKRDASPQTVVVRGTSDTPPKTLRRAAGGGGQLAFEVYALVDADGWPQEATYTFVETVERASADPDL